MNSGYKEYLLYLFGDLTELNVKSESRYWKNNEYPVVLELEKSGNLWVHNTIWNSFSKFFSLGYIETQQIMKDVLEEHLKLEGITPLFFSVIKIFEVGRTFKIGGNHT